MPQHINISSKMEKCPGKSATRIMNKGKYRKYIYVFVRDAGQR